MSAEEPTYREAVIIGWSILWRTVGSFLLLLFLMNLAIFALLPELTRTGPSWWALGLPLVIVTALAASLIMPLVVRAVVLKPFRDFHLEFVRGGRETADVQPIPPWSATRRASDETDYRNGDTRHGAVS